MESDIVTNPKFFSCDGGPHLLLSNSERNRWGKNHPADVLNPGSDYARACNIKPPFGFIDVGKTQALVLGGNPAISGWDLLPNGGLDLFIFERWSRPELDVLRILASAVQNGVALSDTLVEWKIPEGGVTLMFAGDHPGKSVYGEEIIPIQPGTYRIIRGWHEDSRGAVLLLRIVPKG